MAPTGLDSFEARAALTERMNLIVWMKTPKSSRIRREFEEGTSYYDDEETRLLFLRFKLERELDMEAYDQAGPWRFYKGPKDPDLIVAAMVDYEINRMKSTAAEAIPLPELRSSFPLARGELDARGLLAEWGQQTYEQNLSEYESYLFEIQLLETAYLGNYRGPGVFSGAATVNVYEQYIGGPFVSTISKAKEAYPHFLSLMLDFTPIIGQLKAVYEGVTGEDPITGRKLATWEQGLNLLLALIPNARGIFKTGRAGLRFLATTAVKSRRPADEIYRVTKVASTLSEAEVVAAKQIVNGKPANPRAFEKIAGSLEEMQGAKPKGAKSTNYRIAAGVIEDGRGISRSVASSPIKIPLKPPGKEIIRMATPAKLVIELTKAGINSGAIAALEKAGIKITERLAKLLIQTKAGAFVNIFHQCPGFELVVKDLVVSSSRKKGALLVIEFVTDIANKIDPKVVNVKFELPIGITKKTVRGGAIIETASRLTDVVVTDGSRIVNYEFKAYTKAALIQFARYPNKIIQLVKEVAMLQRQSIRWVFDSREVSLEFVRQQFKKAIKSDAVLSKHFGDGQKLEKALDELIVMYPPVPKIIRVPLHGVTRPFADDDKPTRQ